MSRFSTAPRLVLFAAILSAIAAQVHAYVMAEHFHEWWAYGAAFLLMVIFQDVFAVLVVTSPRRPVYLVGIVGTLVMIGLWFSSRFIAVPAGPGAGSVEPVATLDAVTQLVELSLVLSLAALALPVPMFHRQQTASAA
jgi:hypothetical protein